MDIDILIHTFKNYLEDKVVSKSLIDYYSTLDIKRSYFICEIIEDR